MFVLTRSRHDRSDEINMYEHGRKAAVCRLSGQDGNVITADSSDLMKKVSRCRINISMFHSCLGAFFICAALRSALHFEYKVFFAVDNF